MLSGRILGEAVVAANLKFVNGYKPAAGETLQVLSASSLKGKFSTITVDGYSLTPAYSATGLSLKMGA